MIADQPAAQEQQSSSYSLPKCLKDWKYSTPYMRELGFASYLLLQGLVYPLERLKVLQQVEQVSEIRSDSGRYRLRENIRAYRSSLKSQKLTHSLYRGFSVKLTKLFAKEFTAFTIYNSIKYNFNDFNYQSDPFKRVFTNGLAAVIAGVVSELIAYPLETAQTRMICDLKKLDERAYLNAKEALFKDNQPIGQPYKGVLYSLKGAVIYRGIQLGLFEGCNSLKVFDYSPILNIPICVAITIFAQKIVYPIDTIRRHFMLQETPFQVGSTAETATNVKTIRANQDRSFFMKGWKLQVPKSIASGLFLFAYKSMTDKITQPVELITSFAQL